MIALLAFLVVIGFIIGGFFLMDRLDRYLGTMNTNYDKMQENEEDTPDENKH